MSFFLSSFPDDFDEAEGVPLEFVEEDTVYGLKWNPAVVDGVKLADCVLVLLISVAFDIIGATFELLMLSFLADNRVDEGDVDSAKSGTISDELLDLEEDV
jgi:hypothetical protein